MGQRKITFVNDYYYHVFNRGTDKRIIFQDDEDLHYFLSRLIDFNNDTAEGGIYKQKQHSNKNRISPASPIVNIVAYCLLPNHFHLILKQTKEGGIAQFMQRIGTGYVKFFNTKYQRLGSLFEGRFKAKLIETSLPFLSAYVNLNYRHHHIDPNTALVASSYDEYLAQSEYTICDKDELVNVLGEFSSIDDYKKYALDQSDYFKQRKDDLKNEFE